MKVDGNCHCGMIRYEAEVDAEKVVICHCTDCQTLSGTAFRVVVQSLPGTFRLLAGTPKIYLKQAESGYRREQAFCPECGTPLYSAPSGGSDQVVGLRVGPLAQSNELIPRDQYWYRSSLGWIDDLPSIHRQDTQPAFRADGTFMQ